MFVAADQRSLLFKERWIVHFVKEYISSLIAAAVICGILTTLTQKNRSCGVVVKMLCGIFIAVTVISPIAQLQFEDINVHLDQLTSDADLLSQDCASAAMQERGAVIKQQLETYIIDKARKLETEIQVDLTLTQDESLLPQGISIQGAVSPHNMAILSRWLNDELGIPEENQQWN